MNGSQFLDTNVLVYAFDTSEPEKRAIAIELIKTLVESGTGIISTQVLGELFNATVIRKKILDAAEAKLAIKSLTDSFQIVSPSTSEIFSAISIHKKYQLSYWDSLILATAKTCGCQQVQSEDLSDQQDYNGVQVINPFRQIP